MKSDPPEFDVYPVHFPHIAWTKTFWSVNAPRQKLPYKQAAFCKASQATNLLVFSWFPIAAMKAVHKSAPLREVPVSTA